MESLIIVVLLLFGVLVLGLLLNSVILWLAAKLLKFARNDFKTALKTVVVHAAGTLGLYVLLLVVSSILSVIGSSMFPIGSESYLQFDRLFRLFYALLFLITGIVSYVFLGFLIKRFYAVDWKKAFMGFVILFVVNLLVGFILGVLLVAPVLWQFGVFNVGGSPLVTTGFGKLHPLMPSVVYRGDEFSTSFVNGVGTGITVKNVSVTEVIKMEECAVISLPGEVVKAGEVFPVSGNCPYKIEGEPFDVKVEITYDLVFSGTTVTHTETGHIKGEAEAS